MPNLSYQRSVKREREIVNELRAQGYYACRSAGSKSPWDVYAVHPTSGDVKLIQVKTKRGGRGLVMYAVKDYPGHVSEYWYKYGYSKP